MQFNPRSYSSFWDVIEFDEAELSFFFPEKRIPAYRIKGNSILTVDPTTQILRPEVYEWCLDQFGPEFFMDYEFERLYFNRDDVPDPNSKEISDKRQHILSNHRWCVVHQKVITFRDPKDAMLFKLIWSGRESP